MITGAAGAVLRDAVARERFSGQRIDLDRGFIETDRVHGVRFAGNDGAIFLHDELAAGIFFGRSVACLLRGGDLTIIGVIESFADHKCTR